jgi:Leucine rich repeat
MYLILNHNSLQGSIPSCLGSVSKLVDLTLSNNMLEGTLPNALGNLKHLEKLYLDDNALSGNPLPIFNQLTSLKNLMGSSNAFSGTIDSSFLAKSTQILSVDFSHNKFSSVGGFPGHLFNLPLNQLDLSINQLVGPFPTTIRDDTTRLEFLSVYGNKLTGSLASLASLKWLMHLDLSDNSFSGSMDPITELTRLAFLFLSNNPFVTGTIPTAFANLKDLTELSLRNTNRKGKLPELAQQLMLLDLGSNQLTGAIPPSYGQHPRLAYLLLNNNTGLIGKLPSTFARARGLKGVFFDGTGLDNSTMNDLCKLDVFKSVEKADGEVLVGDCLTCSCRGCQCCPPGLIGGCSRPMLDNLDAAWETEFRRVKYDLRNTTAELENAIRPQK